MRDGHQTPTSIVTVVCMNNSGFLTLLCVAVGIWQVEGVEEIVEVRNISKMRKWVERRLMEKARIVCLTVGPAVGSIRELFAKVKSIDAKHGKFEFLLCVGDFFGPGAEEDGDSSKEDDTVQLLDGTLEAPMPCYIMQGDQPLPQKVIERFATSGSEICKNVFLMKRCGLGKSGILTTSHGLRIACLGGVFNQTIYRTTDAPLGFTDPYFSSHTIEKLLANISTTSSSQAKPNTLAALKDASTSSHLIDILISHVWPASITDLSQIPLPPGTSRPTAVPVDDVVRRAKPKYHFATGIGKPPQFWEREPLVWDDEDGRVSRFIGLGAFGGEQGEGKKPRWFYAFSIAPFSPDAAPQPRPTKATANPFTMAPAVHKRTFETSEGENFIFGNVHHPGKRRRNDEPTVPGKPPAGYKCHSISLLTVQNGANLLTATSAKYATKRLIIPLVRPPRSRLPTKAHAWRYWWAKTASRIALLLLRAKETEDLEKEVAGEVHRERLDLTNAGSAYQTHVSREDAPRDLCRVPGGGHVLIVPITHYPTLTSIPSDLALPIVSEVEKYKSALRAFYAKHSCVSVTFEVAILSGKGGHAHVQAVPIPLSLSSKIEEAFRHEGARTGIQWEEDPDDALASAAGGRANYFRVDLPDGKKMVHVITQELPFSIQFGRQVLCNLLKMGDRMDWKACAQPDDEERADALTFKTAFAPFDTTQS
ncbi:hypothetical protein BD410DRAFT_801670 [Rickenella mellea]|uniref:Cwf19-like C-terminal domain-containing protein n=1 Tax=Rickenella mellea TaxID=50990 RepID=A0A4Y7QBX6_9AGAM|nr:hypothetical protein BD410DRAFT_801670 [Rickenella mellea]